MSGTANSVSSIFLKYLSLMEKIRLKIRVLLKEYLNEASSKQITCYHRSNSFEHMERGDFNLENANEVALFGPALYFSESASISPQLGKYVCKFSIKLDTPILNMNQAIKGADQQKIVDLFNKLSKQNFTTDIDDKMYPNVQIGDIFNEISDQYHWDYNIHFPAMIKELGYNSFIYFQNYHSDFINQKGDYGIAYGIYSPSKIKFIDGPF